jgi:hypothetical protein
MVTPAALYRRLPSLSQHARRNAVIAAFVGFPLQLLGYALLVEPGRVSGTLWGPISVVLFSATLIGVVAVYGYGQGRMDRRQVLDERQRTMVDRALVVSYGVVTTVIVLGGGLLAIYLSFIGPLEVQMTVLTPWFIALGLYVPFLPFAALAWIEPDVPGEDDER